MSLSQLLKRYDFSSAFAHLVASAPGYHSGDLLHSFGHMRVRSLLDNEGACFPDALAGQGGSILVAQFSSFSKALDRQRKDLATSFSAGRSKSGPMLGPADHMAFVWPTVAEVRSSIQGYQGGGTLPASLKNVQLVPADMLRAWSSDDPTGNGSPFVAARKRAIPHIKSYARVSSDGTRLAWMCLTSANMSNGAWGDLQLRETQLHCLHWELGVLFTPKTLRNAFNAFSLSAPHAEGSRRAGMLDDAEEIELLTTHAAGTAQRTSLLFPLPYELPPTKYPDGAKPWHCDGMWPDKPDSSGFIGLAVRLW
jgi:tyrosyl-DNA phosphodiesterase-1